MAATETSTPADGVASLDASSPKAREAALEALRGLQPTEIVEKVLQMMERDPNENVRRTAATALATAAPPERAGARLAATLEDGTAPAFVRRGAARSLGSLRYEPAVPVLAGVLVGEAPIELKDECLSALQKVGSPAAGQAFADLVPKLAGHLKARAVLAVAQLAPPNAAEVLGAAAASDDVRVRKAVVRAVAENEPASALDVLSRLAADDDTGVRGRTADALGRCDGPEAETLLLRLVVLDGDEPVRSAAAGAIAGRARSTTLAAALVEVLRAKAVDRRVLDTDRVAIALGPALRSGDAAGVADAETLIGAAIGGDDRLSEAIAGVLIASCGRDAELAGDLVNAYGTRHPDHADQLQRLRVAIGGRKALDPILKQLRDDLETYFQIPIHQLNTDTRESWQAAIDRARQAFMVRMVMSVVVFAIGAVLVVASAVMFLFGDLDTQAAWGTGVSFVGGLGAMLTITYTGPLKDIASSVRDLGRATAAFIGFVHEVSEVSHTFTAMYLQDRLDLDSLERAAALLRTATKDAVAALADEPGASG